jgi:hypothetical protein
MTTKAERSIWRQDIQAIPTLRDLFALGLSAAEIARRMNEKFRIHLTRNAIIGKIQREGLERPKREPRPKPEPKPKKIKIVSRETLPPISLLEALPCVSATELPPDQSECAVSFQRLRDRHCRWPIERPGEPMMYCGAQKITGFYCLRHARILRRGK